MTKLVTVSDDRFGRKGGMYEETQRKISKFFYDNGTFGVTHFPWTWKKIIETPFYSENKNFLEQKDPAMNGRCYKPFVIYEELKGMSDGEYLIYNDSSPEMWKCLDSLNLSNYDLDIAKSLCDLNGGILTAEVVWGIENEKIPHTHENFTLDLCIKTMGLEKYTTSLQHASGLFVIKKSSETLDFVREWLYWNLLPECASLGPVSKETCKAPNCTCSNNSGSSYCYWQKEVDAGHGKIGHRHDQSISGLLINKLDKKLIRGMSSYCFLELCVIGKKYDFVDSNQLPFDYIFKWDHINNSFLKIERPH